jgi:hypothetical protein
MCLSAVDARVMEHLKRLRLGNLADRLDATWARPPARNRPTSISSINCCATR